MSTARVKLCIHESSLPIPNLLVSWYSTSLSSLPKEFLESSKWNLLKSSNWKGLNGTRLGSAYTKEDGVAHLDYNQDKIKGDDKRPLNLWFIVQNPEIVGTTSCGGVIHASCQIITNPSEYEESEIRFPLSIYNKLGVGRNLAPTIDSKRSSDNFNVQLKKIENGSVATLQGNNAPFSKTFNDNIVKGKKSREKVFGRIPKAQSFNMSLVLKDQQNKNDIKTEISFDSTKKTIVITKGGQPLKYKGVERFTKKGVSDKERSKPFIIVDKSSGAFRISLPKVPDDLELSETNPTELFQFANKNK